MTKINDAHEKIASLQQMNASYLQSIKTLVSEMNLSQDFKVISYFTYSLNIRHVKDFENFVLGSFHIQNLGGTPLVNPYICIKLSADSPFNFSGKYQYKDSSKGNLTNGWERINEHTDRQEFWLRPNNKHILEANETLSFSNFQVKWIPESSYAGSIMGFAYGDEMEEGISSLNQINIGGTLGEEGENG
ncbi:hypothetical protein [Virgibacillus ihumii]|uniref:hypothetical protein n=1 Tax=Virgibacillus ihumii TaxID=2686091 RepID=UPI001FE8D2CF|nr:hypothetical protein [Virgibacillus ihumii]